MTLIINPPPGAIAVYPWVLAQDFYVSVVTAIRDSQKLFDIDYDFEVSKNRIHPYIEDQSKSQLVNIMFGDRNDGSYSRISKNVNITYDFEFLVRQEDSGTYKAGEILVERAQYLAAMIEYGLTALYNNVSPSINIGAMDPRELKVKFAKPEDIQRSESLYQFGAVQLDVVFGLEYQDLINLPNLSNILSTIDGNSYLFTANPVV